MRTLAAIVVAAAVGACGRAGFDRIADDGRTNDGVLAEAGPTGDSGSGSSVQPELWFKFDETAGNAAANSGTLASQFMTSFAQQGVVGRVGRAVSLTATTHGVEFADQAALDGFKQLTIAGWIYYDGFNATDYSTVIKKDMAYILRTCDAASCGATKVLSGIVWDSNGTLHSMNVSINPVTGTWYHVAMTYDGSQKPYTLTVFWNGVRVGGGGFNTGTGATQDTTFPLSIGRADPSGENLTGRLDEIRLWNRTLTEQEVCEDAGRTWSGTACN